MGSSITTVELLLLLIIITIIMVSISLQPESGYVFLVVAGTAILNMYQMLKGGGARKKYGVQYPAMYSDKQPEFNCYQRAHQNLIEHLPLFLVLEILAGIKFPKYAAMAGAAWLVGRFIYAQGYYTGNPKGRLPGFGISKVLGEVPLLVMSIITGGNIVGWW